MNRPASLSAPIATQMNRWQANFLTKNTSRVKYPAVSGH